MRLIDAHAHTDVVEALGWIDPPEKVLALMDKYGIEKAVVSTYANMPGINPKAIEYLAEADANYPGRFLPFVRVDPWYGERAVDCVVEAITKYHFKGVKMHPVHYTLHPYGAETVAILKKAAEFDVPVLFHCSDEEMSLPLQIELAAQKVPEAKIICGHTGGYFHCEDIMRMLAEYPNIYCDCCEFPYPKFIKKAVAMGGPEKVLFGTDQPTTNGYVEIQKVKLAGLTPEQEEMVYWKNISKLLKLELPEEDAQ